MRDPIVGDKLDQYELTELLARGGMASIFKAVDTESGETVALKIPHVQFESDVVFFERFNREEEVGQRVEHPKIVRILKPREKSRMYMAMEYVQGTSLRALLQGKRPIPTEKAMEIARQVCAALVYLHAQGIVHRDIKPENILLTPGGQVKILDFGIALIESERRMTWAGFSHTIGTPDYMAPEQVRGRRGDARTDVYALGTMLYEMLTGNLPYPQPEARALLKAKKSDEPRPPSYYVPGFDPSLEAILMKAIEVSPRDRYAGAAELLADLENPGAVPPRDPQTGRQERRPGVRVPRRIAIAMVILVILTSLGWLIWLTHRQAVPSAVPPAAPRVR
ncbi:MAG: serine/threonine-protein kinase [Thermoanaerobaculia bacterium]